MFYFIIAIIEIEQVKEGNTNYFRGLLFQGQKRCFDEYRLTDEEGNLHLSRAYYVPGTY